MTAGSRGDVAPYTGLGHALSRAGHEVTLVTHGCFERLVAGSGVRFHPLPLDPRAELESARGRSLHRSATGLGKLVRVVGMARALAGQMTDDMLAAARDSDVLLLAGSTAPLGHAIAEGLSLPSIEVPLQPLAPTREFGPPMLGGESWGAVGNRVAGHGVSLAIDRVFSAAVPEVRTRLGLSRTKPRTTRRGRALHGYSSLVVPRPSDWPPHLEVTGYWWPYDGAAQLPDELREFLDAGPPPVFVGLGSATVPDPARLSAEVVRALRRAGQRAVIQRGWGGLEAAGDDVLTIGEVPHSALFPRMAAVIHHCGAGTTGAGLRAGVPAVPVPVQFDEGFWAGRLVALGVAPRAVPLRRFTAEALADAVRRATSEPSFGRRARELADGLRGEDGFAPVLDAVNRIGG
ncbi:UDP-glucose:sterol glucosyltransferase [Streptomyces viridochromogenes]|uniref:UDP-glucose:sterol glucosyltransferase n=1 Tax=Streptomyces viridochromogenes TaxID=1938 RepID=A0A0J7ZQL1_STRVR|nr:glycosyltransferase [Streptomyces viridochromogenes]KMS77438.1 UDP-glucose:sterol glucosyltransferase [Streptomyces viridochromogenes]